MKHNPGFLRLTEHARAAVQEIGPGDLKPLRDRLAAEGRTLVLVDVREDHEWAAGHPDGAVHLGRGVLERDVETRFPDLDTPLVLICGGGYRSALAARSLQEMGYRSVWSLDGGVRAWTAAGLPWATDPRS